MILCPLCLSQPQNERNGYLVERFLSSSFSSITSRVDATESTCSHLLAKVVGPEGPREKQENHFCPSDIIIIFLLLLLCLSTLFFSSHIPLNLPSPHFLLAFVFDPISLLSNCSPDAVELLSLSLLCIPQPGIHSRTGFCSAFWRAVLVWYTSTVHVVDLKLPKNPETYTQCRELLAVQVPGMLHCNVKGDTQEGVLWVGRVRPTLQTLLGGSCHSPVGQTTLFKDQSAVSPPRRPMASFHPDLQRCHRKLQQVTWWVLTVSSSAMQLGAFPTPHLPLSYSKGIFPFFVFSHKLAL